MRTTITAPTAPLTEIWAAPARGTQWCDCGSDHPLTRDRVLEFCLTDAHASVITHPQVVRTAMEVWNYATVCRFFHLAVQAAAGAVHGAVAEEYPFETGLAIVKAFSDAWNGCPEELCDEQTDEFGVDD